MEIDKLEHIIVFFCVTFTYHWIYQCSGGLLRKFLFRYYLVYFLLLAPLTEIIEKITHLGEFEYGDILADYAGFAIGSLVTIKLISYLVKRGLVKE